MPSLARAVSSILPALLFPVISAAACIPFAEAARHVGETRCIQGKVAHIEHSQQGTHYLAFCDESGACPFAAVIFPSDLRHIGDVRGLQGKTIEVHGEVRGYQDHTEIVVSEARQLKGEAASMPPLPKHYDVEQRGRYSAGTFSRPKTGKSTGRKRQTPKLPMDLPEDD